MTDISVSKEGKDYQVRVREAGSATTHLVTMDKAYYEILTGGKISEEKCLQSAFRFLLEREPKEAILSRFRLEVIERYFPDFRKRFPEYQG